MIFIKILSMDIKTIKEELSNKGYVIIPNILTKENIAFARSEFFMWFNSIDNFKLIHSKINPHNIFKFHQVGHQYFAWYLRTLPAVQQVFADIWNTNTDNLVCSFDGACYIIPGSKPQTNCWIHTDQAPKENKLMCYQGFVSLTTNKSSSLVVYEGSHLLHNTYFKSIDKESSSKNWHKINPEYLDTIKSTKKILNVPAGSLVLWDSRTFHQNICMGDEERIIQYICMLPKDNPKNNTTQQKKRRKYFEELRTTSHWPYTIKVNGQQPQTYGNKELLIDYSKLVEPKLHDLKDKIEKLL